MKKGIERKQIYFRELVKLGDLPTRKIILEGDTSNRAVDYKIFYRRD